MNATTSIGGYSLAALLLLTSCASTAPHPSAPVRTPAMSSDRPVSSESLAELFKTGLREGAGFAAEAARTEGLEVTSKKLQNLKGALRLEGLSEQTKASLLRDIDAAGEEYREMSRVPSRTTLSRARLGPGHIAELVARVNQSCPKQKINFADGILGFKTATKYISARVDFEGQEFSMGVPYINFVNAGHEGIAIRFGLLRDPKHADQGKDIGGEAFVMFDRATGKLLWANIFIADYVSPLPKGLLKDKLPAHWLNYVTHEYWCEIKPETASR